MVAIIISKIVVLSQNKTNPFDIIQLAHQIYFKNFHDISKDLMFSKISFLNLQNYYLKKFLHFTFVVQFKTVSHGFPDYHSVDILHNNMNSNRLKLTVQNSQNTNSLKNNKLCLNKITDIQFLYKFMPECDKQFYETIFAKYL